jgi:hypothetical protein
MSFFLRLNLRQIARRSWGSKAIEISNPQINFSPNSAMLEGIESQIHSHDIPVCGYSFAITHNLIMLVVVKVYQIKKPAFVRYAR